MKTAIWAFAAILIAVILAIAYVVSNALSDKPHPEQERVATSEEEPQSEQERIATSQEDPHAERTKVPPGSSCENAVSWKDAANYEDQRVSIRGKVVSVVTKENVKGQPTWINIGGSFPEKKRLQVVIWSDDLGEFKHLLPQLTSELVCVTGEVNIYQGVPEITIRSTAQLQIL